MNVINVGSLKRKRRKQQILSRIVHLHYHYFYSSTEPLAEKRKNNPEFDGIEDVEEYLNKK